MRRTAFSILSALVVGGSAQAQLHTAYRDADITGTVDVILEAPIGTFYVSIVSLTEGPTCFGPKHPVGCIDVGFDLFDFSISVPGFFGTMPAPGQLTLTFDIDDDPTLDGVVLNNQLVSLVNGKFTAKSNLSKIVFGYPDSWAHSVASLINDPAGIPAIELDDGRIGLFGGAGANLDQCEAFEPLRQVSTALATLPAGVAGHTVTKLQDGRVLVAGGADINLVVSKSAYVYDPTTDSWTIVGNMSSVRAAHSANLLTDGRVLISGGTTDVSDVLAGVLATLKTTEFFDPTTNTFSNGPSMARPHAGHAAVSLANGDVLVAGGGSFHKIFGIPIPDISNKAQAFQLATGAWTSEVTMKAARAGPSGVLLADGRVLLAGGIGGSVTNPVDLSSAETFDSVTAKFTTVGSMSLARAGMTIMVLPVTNNVLVAGGATGTSVTTALPTDVTELFNPTSNTFSLVTPIPEPRAGAAGIVLQTNHAGLFGGVGAVSPAAIYRD